jgi:hypothetical protein
MEGRERRQTFAPAKSAFPPSMAVNENPDF